VGEFGRPARRELGDSSCSTRRIDSISSSMPSVISAYQSRASSGALAAIVTV
jgi:hypothetical protein